MTRALLGDYQGVILWSPAFTKFLDAVNDRGSGGAWTQELQQIEPENFVSWARTQASEAYSIASKGIHHEFVVKAASYYEEATLRDLMDSSLKVSSALAVVFNFVEHVIFPLTPERALDIFESLQP